VVEGELREMRKAGMKAKKNPRNPGARWESNERKPRECIYDLP